MVNEKYIVDGNDFKKLPLRVAYYARTLGFEHNERLEGIVDSIKDFVEHETSWDLVIGYEDNDCSGKCMCEQEDLYEMLQDAYTNNSGNICISGSFDLIVVTNFYQISRNKEVINLLLDEGELKVPVFCIETGKIVTNDSENLEATLVTRSHMNENKMYELYNMYQDDEMCDYEE